MKKIFIRIVLLFWVGGMYASSPEKIVEKYLTVDKAETELVNSSMLSKKPLSQYKKIAIDGVIDSIRFVNLSNCSPTIKSQFINEVKAMDENPSYRTVVDANKNGTYKKEIVKDDIGTINSVFIFVDANEKKSVGAIIIWGSMRDYDKKTFFNF